ncbi:Glycosyltransferase involved in cell wall bisynthesis [Actinomyces denticolens]|uniref:Glycosyltransferase involved in cell wall bisynthesis n=1 Tax=Actinomyces denticolens TaxID=52767 RepID=A0ABY1HY17_9ACTO|nr:glycosyltransferase family 2 protein [Actinomyces denticolens]SHI29192.1 Glycosyltransferase involved in cell wall bisynthesis [Actinomyces denticolens]
MSAERRHDLLVIIPAWNEEIALPGVIAEVQSKLGGIADIVVVSDGSTDRTAALARSAGVTVLDLPINLGVGGAMRAGFVYAARYGYSHAVQLDADGQHDPSEIPVMLECARATGADLVIGARFAGKGDYSVRGPRHWAMKTLSAILSRVSGTRLTDTTSGFKLYNSRALAVFSHDYPAEYLGDTIEALVVAKRSGLRVRQVAVRMRPRAGGEPSHNPLKAARFLLRAFLALGIALSRPNRAAPNAVPPSEDQEGQR